MITPFDLSDEERIWLDPQNVTSVHEFKRGDRLLSEIKLGNGDKHEVWGHVGIEIKNAQEESKKESWQQ